MHPAAALLVSAFLSFAYFPEGGQSVPAYDSATNYGVDRKAEGVILKKRNDEADQLLEQIEEEKKRIRAELGKLSEKSTGKVKSIRPVQQTTDYAKYSSSGLDPYGVLKPKEPGVGYSLQSSEYRYGPSPPRPEVSPSPPPRGSLPLPLPPSRNSPLPSRHEPSSQRFPLPPPRGFPLPPPPSPHHGGPGFPGEGNLAAMMDHAPFEAKGLYGGVKYKIGFDSDSDEGYKKYAREHKNKKLKIKVAKKTEDGKEVPEHVRGAIKDHLENQIVGGSYRPIPPQGIVRNVG